MDDNKLYTIDVDIAQKLVALYLGYKNGTINEKDTTLSKQEFLNILRFIAKKAGWDPVSEELIIGELNKIIHQEVGAKAQVPQNLKELVACLVRTEELEKERKAGKNTKFAVIAQVSQAEKHFKELVLLESKNTTAEIPITETQKTQEDPAADFAKSKDRERLEANLKNAGVPESAIPPLLVHVSKVVHEAQVDERVLTQKDLEDLVVFSLIQTNTITPEDILRHKEEVVDALLPYVRRQAPEILVPAYDVGARSQI